MRRNIFLGTVTGFVALLFGGTVLAADVAVLNVTSGSGTVIAELTNAGHTATSVTQAEVTGGALSGYDVFIMGRNWCCDNHDAAYRDAVVAFVSGGGGLLTEWDDYAFLFDGYDPTFRYSNALPQAAFISGDVGGGQSMGTVTMDKALDHPIWGALPDSTSFGGIDFPYTTYNVDLSDWDVVATFTGNGTVNFPAQVFPAIIAGRTLPVVGMAFDWGDAASNPDVVGLYVRAVEYLESGVDVEPTGLFNVTKTFSNGDTGDVEVTLTCNGGIPLQQSFTISGGGPGVTFTVTNLPDTGADCEVTESGGNEGYTADLSACAWTGVTGGNYSCPIENVPESTAVTVDTIIDNDDPTIDTSFITTISCDSVNPTTDDNFGPVTVTDSSGMFSADWYADPDGGTDCTVSTVFASSAIEATSCEFSFMLGDDEAGCDVEGTVFFEGIPTLSQYGMAIMVLLMLGVGFVGMRRFV